MNEDKKITTVKDAAEQAEKLEETANTEEDIGTYTHVFKKPFTHEGRTYEKLTFYWDGLSGKDSVAIERELLGRGLTTVLAEFTPEYLAAMAARACTYRNDDGFRTVTADTLYAMPIREFRRICGAARSFLLRAGSDRGAEDDGSENNA